MISTDRGVSSRGRSSLGDRDHAARTVEGSYHADKVGRIETNNVPRRDHDDFEIGHVAHPLRLSDRSHYDRLLLSRDDKRFAMNDMCNAIPRNDGVEEF
jgi:hypothetical protein